MSSSFGELNRRLEAVRHDLTEGGEAERRLLAARQLAPLVAAAVRGDIGDQSMSGWRRGAPISIAGKVTQTVEGIAIDPTARGPMRVLESGRQGYAAGDSRVSGMRTRSDGSRVAKTRKVKRGAGATQGKGTWSDAVVKIAAKAGPVLNEQKVRALARHFPRG